MIGLFSGVVTLAVLAMTFAVFIVFALVIKIAVRLILLPLLLLKWLIGGAVLLIVGPILMVAGLIIAAVLAALFAIPLLPFLLAAGLVWLIVRSARRAAIA
jgi:hypothetical protein